MSTDPGKPAPAAPPPASREAMLYAYLASYDAPCPVCGYNLRALTRNVCPECGHQFRVSIGAAFPGFAALLVFLMPPIMLGGLMLMTVSEVLWELAAHGRTSTIPLGIWLVMAIGAADLLGVLFAYRRRAWFLRKSRGQRRALALASWLVHVAALVGAIACV